MTLSRYVVKINDQPVKNFNTKKDARVYIASLNVTQDIESVSLVRETWNEKLLTIYTPKVTTILTADSLGLDDEGELSNA